MKSLFFQNSSRFTAFYIFIAGEILFHFISSECLVLFLIPVMMVMVSCIHCFLFCPTVVE